MAGHTGALCTLCQQLQQDMACKFGFAANPTWVEDVISKMQMEHAGFDQRPQSIQLQLVLEQLLLTDFRQAGAGGALPVVPKDTQQHTLTGKFMLQLDEAVNISAGWKDRYHEQAGHLRCLKLRLTDGVQQLVAMEYKHIPSLAVLMPAGTKLLVVNPSVKRGILLLQKENVVVLGGGVEQLECARQAMVAKVTQPPGHCNTQRTCHDMYREAAAAAWATAQQQQQGPPAPSLASQLPPIPPQQQQRQHQPQPHQTHAGGVLPGQNQWQQQQRHHSSHTVQHQTPPAVQQPHNHTAQHWQQPVQPEWRQEQHHHHHHHHHHQQQQQQHASSQAPSAVQRVQPSYTQRPSAAPAGSVATAPTSAVAGDGSGAAAGNVRSSNRHDLTADRPGTGPAHTSGPATAAAVAPASAGSRSMCGVGGVRQSTALNDGVGMQDADADDDYEDDISFLEVDCSQQQQQPGAQPIQQHSAAPAPACTTAAAEPHVQQQHVQGTLAGSPATAADRSGGVDSSSDDDVMLVGERPAAPTLHRQQQQQLSGERVPAAHRAAPEQPALSCGDTEDEPPTSVLSLGDMDLGLSAEIESPSLFMDDGMDYDQALEAAADKCLTASLKKQHTQQQSRHKQPHSENRMQKSRRSMQYVLQLGKRTRFSSPQTHQETGSTYDEAQQEEEKEAAAAAAAAARLEGLSRESGVVGADTLLQQLPTQPGTADGTPVLSTVSVGRAVVPTTHPTAAPLYTARLAASALQQPPTAKTSPATTVALSCPEATQAAVPSSTKASYGRPPSRSLSLSRRKADAVLSASQRQQPAATCWQQEQQQEQAPSSQQGQHSAPRCSPPQPHSQQQCSSGTAAQHHSNTSDDPQSGTSAHHAQQFRSHVSVVGHDTPCRSAEQPAAAAAAAEATPAPTLGGPLNSLRVSPAQQGPTSMAATCRSSAQPDCQGSGGSGQGSGNSSSRQGSGGRSGGSGPSVKRAALQLLPTDSFRHKRLSAATCGTPAAAAATTAEAQPVAAAAAGGGGGGGGGSAGRAADVQRSRWTAKSESQGAVASSPASTAGAAAGAVGPALGVKSIYGNLLEKLGLDSSSDEEDVGWCSPTPVPAAAACGRDPAGGAAASAPAAGDPPVTAGRSTCTGTGPDATADGVMVGAVPGQRGQAAAEVSSGPAGADAQVASMQHVKQGRNLPGMGALRGLDDDSSIGSIPGNNTAVLSDAGGCGGAAVAAAGRGGHQAGRSSMCVTGRGAAPSSSRGGRGMSSKVGNAAAPGADIRSMLARQQEFVEAGALPLRGTSSSRCLPGDVCAVAGLNPAGFTGCVDPRLQGAGARLVTPQSLAEGTRDSPPASAAPVGNIQRCGGVGSIQSTGKLALDSDEELGADMERLDQGLW